ncbi:MAG: hypothetical protein MJY47_06260, partial [Fibrobacter sp.]|nr:hypothetical protein [Fibrobacter sp.]
MDKVFDKWTFARFQKVLSLAFGVCMLSFTLTACGDSSDDVAGGSAEEEGIIAIKDKTVSGVSQKGPFVNGSSVTVQELDGETLSQTGNSFEGKIKNDRGEFSVSVKSLASQYVLLKATGFYRNEVTGEKSSSQVTLYALTDLSERSEVNVNLLTHLEYERSLYLVENDSMSVADAKAKAETEVMNAFKIKGEFKNAEDLNIFGVGDENAALLAISVMMQGNLNEANFSERLADFAQDIEDGEWNDGKMQTEIADWTFDENYAQIRTHINSWNLGDEVPAFEKYLNNFWWQNFGLGDCSAENQSEIKQNSNELSAYYENHFICAENGWRIATDLEKDTYKWEAGNDGDSKWGSVNGKNCYVFEGKAWRAGNNSDCSLNLRGCTVLRQDTVGLGSDKVWHICDA